MKAYTDLKQSKKLSKILPIESADMTYFYDEDNGNLLFPTPFIINDRDGYYSRIYCWSLAGLLDYLSANFHVDIKYLDNYWELDCRVQVTYNKELIDACYEMILKLHEQKLL